MTIQGKLAKVCVVGLGNVHTIDKNFINVCTCLSTTFTSTMLLVQLKNKLSIRLACVCTGSTFFSYQCS